ncbi:MAG: hypothetical protein ABJB66_09125, partial [Gemmatimonadaceae bacterium]
FGIPIVYFTTGLHRDYHQVTDEPQYMDYQHMAGIGNYMYDLGVSVANLDHRPVVDGNKPKDPYARCVNNGVVPDSAAIKGETSSSSSDFAAFLQPFSLLPGRR